MAKAQSTVGADGLRWTRAQRAALHGTRRPHPLDPPPVPTTADAGWKAFLREVPLQDAAQGEVEVEPSGEALFAPLRASIETGVAPTTLDTVTEAIRARLVLEDDNTDAPSDGLQGLIAFWVETAGVEWLWTLARGQHDHPITSWMSANAHGRRFYGGDLIASRANRGLGIFDHPKLRTALRRYFFALSEPAFVAQSAAFKRACAETHERILPDVRNPGAEATFVAFVLGRDGAHAHALPTRGANGRIEYISNVGWLLASFTDLAVATEVVRDLGMVMTIDGADFALDFVETFGADAAPLLEAILATTEGRKPKLKSYYKGRFEAAIKLARSAQST